MSKDPGRKWPYIIALSILGVVGLSAWTVKTAINNPVDMSDYGMQGYHEYDNNANKIIEAKIAFDQKYTITFLTPQITENGTVIEYEISDKTGNPINDAKIEAILTRPDTKKFDVNLTVEDVNEGKYTFNSVNLPKVGRWDILARITVGNDQRYYNLKADTRHSDTVEF